MKYSLLVALLLSLTGRTQLTPKGDPYLDSLQDVITHAQHDTVALYAYGKWLGKLYGKDMVKFEELCGVMDSICITNLAKKLKPEEEYFFKRYKANTLYQIGRIEGDRRDYGASQVALEEALRIYEEIGYNRGISKTSYSLATLYSSTGNFERAETANMRLIELGTELEDSDLLSKGYRGIGVLFTKIGRLDQANEYLQLYLELSLKLGNVKMESDVLYHLSFLESRQENYSKAHEYLERCLAICRELRAPNQEAKTLIEIGTLYSKRGINDKSLQYFQKTLEIAKEQNNSYLMASAYSNIGVNHFLQGQHEQAIAYYHKAVSIQQKIGNRVGLSISFNNLAGAYSGLQVFDSVEIYQLKALSLHQEMGNGLGISNSYHSLGLLAHNQKDYQGAVDFYQQALDQAVEVNATLQERIATLGLTKSNLAMSKFAEALPHVCHLIELRDKDIETNFSVLSEKQQEQYFQTMASDHEVYLNFSLHYKDSLPSITEKSYDLSLQLKGMLLKSTSAMRRAILASGDTAVISLYQEWLGKKQEMANGEVGTDRLAHLEKETEDMEAQLARLSVDYSLNRRAQDLSWKEIQRSLGPGEKAIEFVRFSTTGGQPTDSVYHGIYCALIIDGKSAHPQMVKLCDETALRDLLGEVPGSDLAYVAKLYGTTDQPSQELYKMIWEPLESYLGKAKIIYASPVGLLHNVAVAGMVDMQGRYLSERYRIHMMSTTADLLRADTRLPEESNFALYGGIRYGQQDDQSQAWQYLVGTERETLHIGEILKNSGQQVDSYTGADATEENFKAQVSSKDVVHIATHGFFYPDPDLAMADVSSAEVIEGDITFRGSTGQYALQTFVQNQDPLMRSGLVFAGANESWRSGPGNDTTKITKDDGILTAQEVATVDMRKTRLVVLSACETGLGDIKGSEGVYGLQRAFKMSGVRYMLMSLWQVPDAETAEFMELFYTNLSRDGDIRSAFLNTQDQMRKKYDPYYWAAFVLMG